MTLQLPYKLHTSGREFETVKQARQQTACFSGMQQMLCSVGSSKSFAITVEVSNCSKQPGGHHQSLDSSKLRP
jgi:hypothetical protein